MFASFLGRLLLPDDDNLPGAKKLIYTYFGELFT